MKALTFLPVILLVSCTNDSRRKEGDQNPKEMNFVVSNGINKELDSVALNGVTFEGNYYSVIAQREADLFKDSAGVLVRVKKNLNRGDVYSKLLKARLQNNKIPISVPDSEGVYFIEESTNHFDQPLEGMRFPVQGIVQSDDAELEFYDELKEERIRKKLLKGTPYFFVHYKDCAVINVWDIENSRPIQGMYCGKLNIQQASDHIKINPKYKSTLERWFN